GAGGGRGGGGPGKGRVGSFFGLFRIPATVSEAVREFVRRDLRAAVMPWAVARVLVIGSLALTRFGVDHIERARRPVQLGQGLFAWDAAFYRDIAEHGYGAVRTGALRFFPLLPLLTPPL